MRSSILLAMALFTGAASSSFSQDYFPLQTGNQWLFRGSRTAMVLQVEVGRSEKLDDAEYFSVSGLGGGIRWLRRGSDGAILEYDRESGTVRPFLSLQFPEGQTFATSMNECSRSARIESRNAKVDTPAAGARTDAVQVRYVDSPCADAGLESDYFLAGVGLVRRVETTFAGPVAYELIYAKVNGALTLARAETSFAVSVPSPVLPNSRVIVRMTVRNGGPEPLRLDFNSGQIFNLQLTAADGTVVYNWAADKLFIAVLQTISVERERNWLAEFQAPADLKPGWYTLEAYLTTAAPSDLPFRASVAVQVIDGRQ